MERRLMCFNSTLVRLKLPHAGMCGGSDYMFQFHTGSIKAGEFVAVHKGLTLFQFHTGSIKALMTPAEKEMLGRFQFHTGSIKAFHY